MTTPEQISKSIANISASDSLRNLEFRKNEILKQLDGAVTIDPKTKSILKSSLALAVSKKESAFAGNLLGEINAIESRLSGAIKNIWVKDMRSAKIDLDKYRYEVSGSGSRLVLIENLVSGLSCPSAQNIIQKSRLAKSNLESLLARKAKEISDEAERLRKKAIEEEAWKRAEEERRRREEEEKKKKAEEARRRAMMGTTSSNPFASNTKKPFMP